MYLPNPCYEDWSKMTPTQHGRTCASCNSLVADMTRLSNDEILALISKGKVHCGRFYEDQLEVPQIKGGVLSALFGKLGRQWAFLSMLALLELSAPSELSAKGIVIERIEEGRSGIVGDSGVAMPGFIQGTVVRKYYTSDGVQMVSQVGRKEVFLYNNKGKCLDTTLSDDKGIFVFAIPEGKSQDKYTLVLKKHKTKTKHRVQHYGRVKATWSEGQPSVELVEEYNSRRKLFAPRRVITGKFR